MFRATAFLASVLFAAAALAQGNPPGPKQLRVLFVGNSLTYWTDIPRRVQRVAEATGRKADVEMIAYPSFSLEDHWFDGRAMAAIKKGGWDYVVLQQGSSGEESGRAQLIDYSKRFAAEIRKAGAKPAMYQVWPLSDRQQDFPNVIQSYRLAAKETDALLIPAGEAWMRALSKDRRLKLYSDGIHPSSFGSDIAVLAIYLSLFPAGPQEFDEAFVGKVARALEIPADRRDAFFDAATLAIDSPFTIQ